MNEAHKYLSYICHIWEEKERKRERKGVSVKERN